MKSIKEVLFPESPQEALHLLKSIPDYSLVAGGTDLIPKIKRDQKTPSVLISLSRCGLPSGVIDTESEIRIGAMAPLRVLEEDPRIKSMEGLHKAVCSVATSIIRHSATAGGNIFQDTRCLFYDKSEFWRQCAGFCLKAGGDECRAAPGSKKCFSVLCSDMAAALVSLNATVHIQTDGEEHEEVPLADLYTGDGIRPLRLEKFLATEIVIKKKSIIFSDYMKMRVRSGFDFPEPGVALAVIQDNSALIVRVGIAGIAPCIVLSEITIPELSALSHVPELMEQELNKKMKTVDNLFLPPLYRKKVAIRFVKEMIEKFRNRFRSFPFYP